MLAVSQTKRDKKFNVDRYLMLQELVVKRLLLLDALVLRYGIGSTSANTNPPRSTTSLGSQ